MSSRTKDSLFPSLVCSVLVARCVLMVTTGTELALSNPAANRFIIEPRNKSSIAPLNDYLRAIKSTVYYNFLPSSTGTRRLLFSVTDTTGLTTISTVAIRLRRASPITCTAASRNQDVVFLLDSSEVSSSPDFWQGIVSFVSTVVRRLPIASDMTRYDHYSHHSCFSFPPELPPSQSGPSLESSSTSTTPGTPLSRHPGLPLLPFKVVPVTSLEV